VSIADDHEEIVDEWLGWHESIRGGPRWSVPQRSPKEIERIERENEERRIEYQRQRDLDQAFAYGGAAVDMVRHGDAGKAKAFAKIAAMWARLARREETDDE